MAVEVLEDLSVLEMNDNLSKENQKLKRIINRQMLALKDLRAEMSASEDRAFELYCRTRELEEEVCYAQRGA